MSMRAAALAALAGAALVVAGRRGGGRPGVHLGHPAPGALRRHRARNDDRARRVGRDGPGGLLAVRGAASVVDEHAGRRGRGHDAGVSTSSASRHGARRGPGSEASRSARRACTSARSPSSRDSRPFWWSRARRRSRSADPDAVLPAPDDSASRDVQVRSVDGAEGARGGGGGARAARGRAARPTRTSRPRARAGRTGGSARPRARARPRGPHEAAAGSTTRARPAVAHACARAGSARTDRPQPTSRGPSPSPSRRA